MNCPRFLHLKQVYSPTGFDEDFEPPELLELLLWNCLFLWKRWNLFMISARSLLSLSGSSESSLAFPSEEESATVLRA